MVSDVIEPISKARAITSTVGERHRYNMIRRKPMRKISKPHFFRMNGCWYVIPGGMPVG